MAMLCVIYPVKTYILRNNFISLYDTNTQSSIITTATAALVNIDIMKVEKSGR